MKPSLTPILLAIELTFFVTLAWRRRRFGHLDAKALRSGSTFRGSPPMVLPRACYSMRTTIPKQARPLSILPVTVR